jgi:hypothetical protein
MDRPVITEETIIPCPKETSKTTRWFALGFGAGLFTAGSLMAIIIGNNSYADTINSGMIKPFGFLTAQVLNLMESATVLIILGAIFVAIAVISLYQNRQYCHPGKED